MPMNSCSILKARKQTISVEMFRIKLAMGSRSMQEARKRLEISLWSVAFTDRWKPAYAGSDNAQLRSLPLQLQLWQEAEINDNFFKI